MKPRELVDTYGVLTVKPRTAGRREMRATAAAGNFMASAERSRRTTGCGRRCQQTEATELTPTAARSKATI